MLQETPAYYIYPKAVLFRKKVNDYNGIKLRKSLDAVQNAKFSKLPLVFYDSHIESEENKIGFVKNVYLDQDKWRGDVHFQKKKMSQIQKDQLLNGEKRDVSIQYKYDIKLTPEVPGVDGDQYNLLVDHLAWVDHGRCPTPYCGLDEHRVIDKDKLSQLQGPLSPNLFNTDGKLKIPIFSYENFDMIKLPEPEPDTPEDIEMTDCEGKDQRIKELETQLKAQDSAERAGLDKKVKELTSQLEAKDAASKTEKDGLTKQIADLEKTSVIDQIMFKAKSGKYSRQQLEGKDMAQLKVAFDQEETEEKAKLMKEITEKSSFTEEQLQGKSLEELRAILDVIKKAKPATTDGYPPGKDGNKGDPEAKTSSPTEIIDLRSLIPPPESKNTGTK